ncbi:hypothetical protein Tco_1286674 [Tanacetum coccineum]
MYQGRHKDLERSCTSWKSVAPVRNRSLVYPDSDEKDEEYCSLPPLLLCFQTPQPCTTFNYVHHNSHSEVDIENMTLEEHARYELAMSTMKSEIQEDSSLDEILDDLLRIGAEHIRKMEHEVPNRCDDITDYKDSNQEDGELPDLPTFSATNEFASVCKQVEENIDVNTAGEIEEPVQIDAHGVVLGLYMATRTHFKSGLVGYHADDDDVLELWMLLMEMDLKHGLEHAVFSSSRENLREYFILILLLFLNFHFLNVK